MKCKIDEAIYWIKENHGYSNEFGCIMVESEMLQELLEQLRPYVELGELVFNNLIDIELKHRNDYIELVKRINQIKEQKNGN